MILCKLGNKRKHKSKINFIFKFGVSYFNFLKKKKPYLIASNDLLIEEEIGRGAYGVVFKGQ